MSLASGRSEGASGACVYFADVHPMFCFTHKGFQPMHPRGRKPLVPLSSFPTALQLAIYRLPLHFLSQDKEALFQYISQSILNHKATPVLSARYHNPERVCPGTKQATSVGVTIYLYQMSALTSWVSILLPKRKLETPLAANGTS